MRALVTMLALAGMATTAPAAAAPAGGAPPLKVVKHPVEVVRRTFDPANPPADMPPLSGNEAAVTASHFAVKTSVSYTPGSTKKKSGGWTSSIRTQGIGLELNCKITIWLPKGASAKLEAHEEGHRQITEKIYLTAHTVAKGLADAYVGRGATGEGATKEAATQAALKSLMQTLADQYLNDTNGRVGRVGGAYDELTAHGTKASPAEPEAIRLAFAREDKAAAQAKRTGARDKKAPKR